MKRKRYLDSEFYVELRQDPGGTGTRWKPSGLSVTEAEFWVYVIADTGLMLWFPTEYLRWVIREEYGHEREETDGDNPTAGRLLRANLLLDLLQKWEMSR